MTEQREEIAEQVDQEPPVTQGSRRQDLSSFMPVIIVIIVSVGVMLLCGLLASSSGF